MSITKSALLRASAKVSPVEIPGVEGSIGVRSLTVAQVLGFVHRPEGSDSIESLCHLVQVGTADEDGSPLFADGDEVKSLDFATLNALATAVLKANKLGQGDDEALAKNSEAIPSA